MYTISCYLVGQESTLKENQTFNDVCDWLKTNKYHLFGYYIIRGIESWSAEHFYRYETKLPI